jgi:hypothetical protein
MAPPKEKPNAKLIPLPDLPGVNANPVQKPPTTTEKPAAKPTAPKEKPTAKPASLPDLPGVNVNPVQKPTTTTEKPSATTEAPTPDFHFKLYSGINCLSGVRGGISDVPKQSANGDALVQECQHQCLVEKQCEGIVTRTFKTALGLTSTRCWLQTQEIDRDKCKTEPDFNLWLKEEGKAKFNCTMENRMDWPVQEYEWCCGQGGLGCLEQSDLSAKFEQKLREEAAHNLSLTAMIPVIGLASLTVGAAAMLILVAARGHQLPYQFLNRAENTHAQRPRRGGRNEPDNRRLLMTEGEGAPRDFLEPGVPDEEPHRSRVTEEASPVYAFRFADGKRVTLM